MKLQETKACKHYERYLTKYHLQALQFNIEFIHNREEFSFLKKQTERTVKENGNTETVHHLSSMRIMWWAKQFPRGNTCFQVIWLKRKPHCTVYTNTED